MIAIYAYRSYYFLSQFSSRILVAKRCQPLNDPSFRLPGFTIVIKPRDPGNYGGRIIAFQGIEHGYILSGESVVKTIPSAEPAGEGS